MTALQPYLGEAIKKVRPQKYHEQRLKKYTSLFKTKCLTAREQETAFHILSGLTNREIAQKLGLSVHTVKGHVKNIFRKLGINKRNEIFLIE